MGKWLVAILCITLSGCTTANLAPVVSFQMDATSGEPPVSVRFSASETFDPDGEIIDWQWDFGDGNTGQGQTVIHVYIQSGVFNVTLTVTDNQGGRTNSKQSLTIGTPRPTAQFSITPSSGWVPFEITFDADIAANTNDSTIEYFWDFGDGQDGRGVQVRHRYQTQGEYIVTLLARNVDGERAETQQIVRAMDLNLSSSLPTVAGPTALVVGEFNGDNDIDVVISSGTSRRIGLMAGDGQGGFQAPEFFTIGRNPRDMVGADFNRDGLTDLAITNFDDASLTLMLGTEEGRFIRLVNLSAGDWPFGLATADLNNDDWPDLISGNAGDASLSIFLNDEGQGFSEVTPLETGRWPTEILAEDLNLDGNIDIVVSNFFADSVSVFFGSGTGSFGPRSDYNVGIEPMGLAMADLDKDGLPDLAVANSGEDTVSFLTQRSSGIFEDEARFNVDRRPWALALDDVDDNGWPDLITASTGGGGVSVWLSRSTLEFGQRRGLSLGDEPLVLQSADLTGDGTNEWLTIDFASNRLLILNIR